MYFQSSHQQTVKCKSCRISRPFTYFNFNGFIDSRIGNVDFSFSSIAELTDASFFDFTNHVHTLNLSYNNIKLLIRPKLFHNTQGLRNLSLGHNQIEHILPEAFLGSQKLELLDLQHNKLTYLPWNAFESLINLKTLNLENNKLQSIHDQQFIKNIHLRSLNLNNNKIERFDEMALSVLKELIHFEMDNNRMESIKPIYATASPEVRIETKSKENLGELKKKNIELQNKLVNAYLEVDELNKTLESFHEKIVVLEQFVGNINRAAHLKGLLTDSFKHLVRNVTEILGQIRNTNN